MKRRLVKKSIKKHLDGRELLPCDRERIFYAFKKGIDNILTLIKKLPETLSNGVILIADAVTNITNGISKAIETIIENVKENQKWKVMM